VSVAPATARSPYGGEDTLVDAGGAMTRLHAFFTMLETAGLTESLREKGPLTVFAPTDQAFSRVPPKEMAALLKDKARLAQVLRHHVISGRIRAPRDERPGVATPQFGGELHLTATKGTYHVNDARVVKTNIRAANGVIHAIDAVLMP
jgi:uncharacterized surface protein with fasciclin (FAS1) repeats